MAEEVDMEEVDMEEEEEGGGVCVGGWLEQEVKKPGWTGVDMYIAVIESLSHRSLLTDTLWAIPTSGFVYCSWIDFVGTGLMDVVPTN